MKNIYDDADWLFMLGQYKRKTVFDINEYYKILSDDFPAFLKEYAEVPSMKRLKGVGLMCGTDWTPLYKNRFFYSRFDHSIGTALIVWNFTHDKIQTLSALFHDIATPVFSHVADFRKGDALTQTATENETEQTIKNDEVLCKLLHKDKIDISAVYDYHMYPIADNERPKLSADRLEYMFPSGATLQGSWNLEEIKEVYKDIVILKDENNIDELGFKNKEIAENYCKKFLETGHVLQLNENKLTLQLLAEIVNLSVELKILKEKDCFDLSEKMIVEKLDSYVSDYLKSYGNNKATLRLCRLIRTFRSMEKIEHTALPPEKKDEYFCVSLKVKQRYINPLVLEDGKPQRLSKVSEKASALIGDFLSYEDTNYGCVKLKDIWQC